MLLAAGQRLTGQDLKGSWEAGFNHGLLAAEGAANDFNQPFTGPGYVPPPYPPPVTNPATPATQNFFWGQGNPWTADHMRPFNAIHMALIPKGPHRGKVLVWGAWYPVVLRPRSALSSSEWSFQAWSIIDPNSTTARFRNYLLPLNPVQPGPTPYETGREISDMFCTGHAWTQNGDLGVAGGATSWVYPEVVPPAGVPYTAGGAKFLYLFDPLQPSQPWQGLTSLYPGEFGFWKAANQGLLVNRFYPTVTLTHALSRNNLNREIDFVAGGSDAAASAPADPSNTYETYVPRSVIDPLGSLTQDPDPPVPPPGITLPGPVTGGAVALHDEHFDEYPRLHTVTDNAPPAGALSAGALFMSGPALLSSKTNQDIFATGTPPARPWNTSVGRNAVPSGWGQQRHDGTSLILCFNGLEFIVRLGGGNGTGNTAVGTDTAEFCIANGLAVWQTLPAANGVSTIPGGPRMYSNAVVLPDRTIVVIGGATTSINNPNRAYVPTVAVYRVGVGWQEIAAPSPTRRAYHAVAMLLPDGRVIVGGGELTSPLQAGEHDYDIYVPHYLVDNLPRPQIVNLTHADGSPLTIESLSSTQEMALGGQFTVECDNIDELDHLDRVVLIAPGSITHHSDMSARYVELSGGLLVGNNQLKSFVLPGNGTLPRGFYMMFAVNSAGIPSVARWVKVV